MKHLMITKNKKHENSIMGLTLNAIYGKKKFYIFYNVIVVYLSLSLSFSV